MDKKYLLLFTLLFFSAILLAQQQEDTFEDSTAITGQFEKDLKPFKCSIFPKEVKSYLQVVLPMDQNFSLRLIDSNGQILFHHLQIFGENQVNLGHLKADKYFLEISSPMGQIREEITKT
jgi:hypothetical protein